VRRGPSTASPATWRCSLTRTAARQFAGGLVDWSTGERARQRGMSLRRALVAHEATAILQACGDAIVTGMTQTNANDLVPIVAR
jgi:glycerate-2-kinase